MKDCLEVETISNQLFPSCLGEFLCWELSWCGFPHDCPHSALPGRVAGLQCCSAALPCRLCCAGNSKERPDLDRAGVLGDLGHQVEKQCRLQHRCCSAATQLTNCSASSICAQLALSCLYLTNQIRLNLTVMLAVWQMQ